MARLDYVSGDGEVADRIRRRRGGELTPLDAMLLHSPALADGWNSLLGAVRGATSLPADIRELAILRVAQLNGAEYEWHAHEPVARRAGLTDPQLAAVRDAGGAGSDGVDALTAVQRAALAYTDAMTRHITVPDALFDTLTDFLDQRQIVELTATVGTYNLVSRFLVALQIDIADRQRGVPA
jgi:4-carboxymuconolactone decarboxylase